MAVLREGTRLPQVMADDEATVLDLLATEREALVADATALCNRIHKLLMHIDPEYMDKLPRLASKGGVRKLLRYSTRDESPLQQSRAALVRRHAKRMALAIEQASELERQIEELARPSYEPLTELPGVSLLTAGALAGILGGGRRFEREAQLAAYGGVAPLETSSAGTVRHRLNRSGNRRLNAILYRIVLTQSRRSERARTYLERRMSEGRTRREAVRALKRHIVRAIWRLWQKCLALKSPQAQMKTVA
jgi:transposase